MALQAKTEEQQVHIRGLLDELDLFAVSEDGIGYDGVITFDEMAQIVDYLRTSVPNKELFETCWVAYRRKGSKKKSLEYWKKLTDKEKDKVLPHVKAYVASRDLVYQKDFERYLRDKIFNTIVIDKNNTVTYDPARQEERNTGMYLPEGRTIWFNEATQSYWSMDNFYDERIYDGYTDDTRPDGATITLNNARGTYKWNSINKKWERK